MQRTPSKENKTLPIIQDVSESSAQDFPQSNESDSQKRMREPKLANEEDMNVLGNFKQFFNNWQFPPQCQHLQQAIAELLRAFERTLLEQKSAIETKQITISENEPSHFSTDEEQLAMETDWVTTNRRKQKKKSTLQSNKNQDGLRKPPPIKIESTHIKTITSLAEKANVGEANFVIKPINNKIVKVNFENEVGYRNMVTTLKECGANFYTYENKQTRPIRVVAKGLSYQWDEKEVFDFLKTTGYKITNVSKRLSAKDKSPLNMFTLSFDREENIDSIYKIKTILHNVVEICPIKGNKLVPQCKNCQEYGHTKNHCNKKPRCVKCGQGHLTATCQKLPQARPKCANCEGDHPANYRGCTIAKEAQALRKEQRKVTKIKQHPIGINTIRKNHLNQKPLDQKAGPSNVNKSSIQRPWNEVVKSSATQIQQDKFQEIDSPLFLILSEIKGLRADMMALSKRVETLEARPVSLQSKNK